MEKKRQEAFEENFRNTGNELLFTSDSLIQDQYKEDSEVIEFDMGFVGLNKEVICFHSPFIAGKHKEGREFPDSITVFNFVPGEGENQPSFYKTLYNDMVRSQRQIPIIFSHPLCVREEIKRREAE